jgi:hypothetical protein
VIDSQQDDAARHASAPAAPVLLIARAEVRSRWLGLVLIGLLAGLVGAVSVSAVALARRTTTAYDRLSEVTQVADAHGLVLGHPEVADEVGALPMVDERWLGGTGVAKLDGDNSFLAVIAGPRDPSPLIRPLVLEGRLPGPATEPDVIEVALRDDFQREFGVPMGTEVPVRFLSEEDFFRFDTGFEDGEVHGPTAVIRVVGTVRLAGSTSGPAAFASGEVLTSYPDAFIGSTYYVRLAGGAAGFDAFRAAVEELPGERALPPEATEFPVVDAVDELLARAAVDNTALLLGRALLVFAAATAIVGGVAVVQALSRHHTATASARAVERALGLSAPQQTAARLLAGLLPATLATVLTAAGAWAAARIGPIGAIRLYEPRPGAALNVTVVAIGVLLVFIGVLAAATLTGALYRARRADALLRESRVVNRVTRVGASPPTVLGLRFALEAGNGARAVPVRSAITGAVVGVAGAVAGLVFVASLDRLVESPSRSGIPFEVIVSDVTAKDMEPALEEAPVGDVVIVANAPLVLDGLDVDGHAMEPLRGSLDIGVQDGRFPQTPDEITLGLRVARDLDVGVGDTVTAQQPDGGERKLAVVGLAVIPTFNGEELGANGLLTPEGLEGVGLTSRFSEAAVEAAPGHTTDDVLAVLTEEFEADAQRTPVAVQNLAGLGRLPAGVAAIVGSIAVLALANALVVAVRRRRRDLAVVQALGFTDRQTAATVVVMALAIVAIGVTVGVPIGMAVGATLWRVTASGAFVLSDASFRWGLLTLPIVGSVAIALVAATIPARQAATQSAVDGLRAE